MRWTKEEIKILKNEYEKGTSGKDIASILNRSYPSIQTKVSRLKIANIKIIWTKQEIETLKNEYKKGTYIKDIASILNRSYSSVSWKASCLKIAGSNFHNKTHEQYVLDLKERCPEIIVLDKYINADTKILHKCLVCGEKHYAIPYVKLEGKGHCGHRSRPLLANKPGIVYLVYFKNIDLYKIGVTQRTVKQRMYSIGYKSDIILERHFDTGTECIELEKEWLFSVQDFKTNTGLLKDGNTETFRYIL